MAAVYTDSHREDSTSRSLNVSHRSAGAGPATICSRGRMMNSMTTVLQAKATTWKGLPKSTFLLLAISEVIAEGIPFTDGPLPMAVAGGRGGR